jgi:hypothetical protein
VYIVTPILHHLTTPLLILICITLFLGGGAAWLTGRAVALSWQPLWRAWIWMVPLAAAVRFIHFSLFHGGLLEAAPYAFDFFVLIACASIGHWYARRGQMRTQYAFERAGHTVSAASAGGS